MKAIFLDIDGVLNSIETKVKAPSGCIGIDADKCERLAKIVQQTGAFVVLTSTWKTDWFRSAFINDLPKDGQYLEKTLLEHNILIYDKTTDTSWSQRAEGILDFINNCDQTVESFVILDDEFTLDYARCGLDKYHVKTYYSKKDSNTLLGLQDYHVEKAVNILNDRKS